MQACKIKQKYTAQKLKFISGRAENFEENGVKKAILLYPQCLESLENHKPLIPQKGLNPLLPRYLF